MKCKEHSINQPRTISYQHGAFIKKKNKKHTTLQEFTHIMWTKRIRKHTDTCWRKMGCLPGHPQAYTLESPWIFTWGALGIPKLELLPLLLLLTSRSARSSNTSSTQNLTELLVAGLVHMINEIPSCTALTLLYNYKQTLPTVCYHNSMAPSQGGFNKNSNICK